MTRFGYTVAYLGLLVAYIVIAALLMSTGAPGWTQLLTLAGFVGCWHAISARRIAEVALPWLHAAPYLSILCLMVAIPLVGEAEAQSAPLHPISVPAWHEPATVVCLLGALIWPAATIALSILPSRRR